jgi:hypothetical protein
VLNSIGRGVFIGVLGAVTDLIKLVIRQVLAGRPRHVASWPSSAASTNSSPRVPFHYLLDSVTAKETHGRLQSGARQSGSLAEEPATRPTHRCGFENVVVTQIVITSMGWVLL